MAEISDSFTALGFRCDSTTDARWGLHLARNHRYIVILLDASLPPFDDVEVGDAIRREGTFTPLLIMASPDELKRGLRGFQPETDDYVIRPFGMDELFNRVRLIADFQPFSDNKLVCSDLVLDLEKHEARRGGKLIQLTPIRWTLLEKLMRASPRAVGRHELEAAIWGDSIPSNNLKVHMHHLRKAVDEKFESPLIVTIPGAGFAIQSGYRVRPKVPVISPESVE